MSSNKLLRDELLLVALSECSSRRQDSPSGTLAELLLASQCAAHTRAATTQSPTVPPVNGLSGTRLLREVRAAFMIYLGDFENGCKEATIPSVYPLSCKSATESRGVPRRLN